MYELIFSTVNFMKPKYRSDIFGENLVTKLECAVSVKDILSFKSLVWKNVKYFITYFYIDNMLKWSEFGYTGLNKLQS